MLKILESPQNRERIYIIGFKDPSDFEFPEPPYTPTKVGDILEKTDKIFTLTDHQWKYHQDRKSKMKAKGYGFGYSLFNERFNIYKHNICQIS